MWSPSEPCRMIELGLLGSQQQELSSPTQEATLSPHPGLWSELGLRRKW